MKLLFNNLIRIIKDNLLLIFLLSVVLLVSAYAEVNDFDLTPNGWETHFVIGQQF